MGPKLTELCTTKATLIIIHPVHVYKTEKFAHFRKINFHKIVSTPYLTRLPTLDPLLLSRFKTLLVGSGPCRMVSGGMVGAKNSVNLSNAIQAGKETTSCSCCCWRQNEGLDLLCTRCLPGRDGVVSQPVCAR